MLPRSIGRPANRGGMSAYHDRIPIILDWSPERGWMRGDHPAALLRPAPEDALQEWVVGTRANRAGVGDDDPALIDPV